MRFLSIDLRNYGPFLNAPVLDLRGGDRGLHLIVGPNEAGKSTALRAIRALLFDFTRSTPDDHGRDVSTLRIGATLRGESGDEVAFIRRKRGVKLHAVDDQTPLSADALAPLLGKLDEATFVDLFSTDHAELLEGGRAIIRGGGRLGAMLFSAGSGLAQLDKVQASLQDEMDKLFKSRNATLPAINKTLAELKQARKDVVADALPTSDWVDANARWTRLIADRSDVSRQKHEAQAELDRSKSRLGALRILPRRQTVLDRLEARGSTSVLRPGFADVYQQEAEAARTAKHSLANARDALLAAEAALESLGPPDPSLLEADAIQRLHSDLGQYNSARRDRPDLAIKLARVENQARAIRADLPQGAMVPTGGGLGSLRDPIQKLAQEHAALLVKKQKADADLALFDSASPEPLSPGVLPWVPSLEAAIGRAAEPGALELRRLEAWSKLHAAEGQAATSLQGLSLWSGTLDALESLAIPPDATFDRFDAEIGSVDDRIKSAEAERVVLETKRLDIDREADRAKVAGPIPTEADLQTRRSRRDSLWLLIRRAWVDREPLAPAPSKLADDFEGETHLADALSDSLRREADRVAAAAHNEIDRRDLLDRITLWTQTLAGAEADRVALLDRWAELWEPLGIEPLPPREMKNWVKIDRKERIRCAKGIRDARVEVDRISAQIDQLRGELGHALVQVGEPPVAPGESLAAVLARGRIVVDRIGSKVKRDAARGRLAEVATLETAWLDRWKLAVEPIGLPFDASVSTASAVIGRLGDWIDATREAEGLRDDLDDLDAIVRRFADEAGALAGQFGIEAEPSSDGEDEADWQPVVSSMMNRLDRARKANTRRENHLGRISEEQSKQLQAQSALGRANDALAALASEARVSTVDLLPEAIRRSLEVEADLADLRRFDEQLDDFAGSITRAALLEAVAVLDDATLSTRIAELTETLAALEAESSRLGEEIGAARERLDRMNVGPGAHESQQVVQGHIARLGGEVERYARLKLASAVLRTAVEQHRLKNQGPVLDRAGALFARLTAGSFVGLKADLDDNDDPILRGVRGRGQPIKVGEENDTDNDTAAPLVDVAAMSEGTADQLYLALRLASLSVHLDDHPPAPFVVDDILINFDDVRAKAALEALAELSKRTQVLFFTHHDHLAEIARAGLPADVLFVHRLIPKSEVSGNSQSPDQPPPKSRRKRTSSASLTDLQKS